MYAAAGEVNNHKAVRISVIIIKYFEHVISKHVKQSNQQVKQQQRAKGN
jgi:hypothetical protein